MPFQQSPMTATNWGDLFDRGASYAIDLERIRAVDDELDESVAETGSDGTETEEVDDGA